MTTSPVTVPSRGIRGFFSDAITELHLRCVHRRRVRRLADAIAAADLVPGRWLDIGCGDGRLGRLIMQRRPGVQVSGIDVLPRANTVIPVSAFDGRRIKCADHAFTGAIIADVLHHTDDPEALLREALRVINSTLIIKDVAAESRFEHKLLAVMDYIANRPHGVYCPCNYFSRREWDAVFGRLGLAQVSYKRDFRLYAYPFTYLFDGRLHFVATLTKRQDAEGTD